MSSVVRSVLGAALLLTGASAAMAQSDNPAVAEQAVQNDASTQTAASNNAPVVEQTVQTSASTVAAASDGAPIAEQSTKIHHAGIWCDNTDAYGGHGPNTLWGIRAFWDTQGTNQ
jgi:hypothetical protein